MYKNCRYSMQGKFICKKKNIEKFITDSDPYIAVAYDGSGGCITYQSDLDDDEKTYDTIPNKFYFNRHINKCVLSQGVENSQDYIYINFHSINKNKFD